MTAGCRVGLLLLVLVASSTAQSAFAPAGEPPSRYAVRPLPDVPFEGDRTPGMVPGAWPAVVLDGAGEAYYTDDLPAFRFGLSLPDNSVTARIAVSAPGQGDVTGRLFGVSVDGAPAVRSFRIPADALSPAPEAKREFLLAERDHYAAFLDQGLPGAAWWRHRVDALSRELGEALPETFESTRPPSNMDDTFALFTGGRAVAENLQLDRMLPATPGEDEDLVRDVDALPGISVTAYDWTAAVAGKSPALDPLAALIPADQHAVFFPSFTALADMADRLDEQGTLVLEALSSPSEEALTRARYERQLGLPFSDVARLLGPHVIRSVALTGGDPYLRSGSDVALLFQAVEPAVLLPLVQARVAAATADEAGAGTRTGTIDGIDYAARLSPGREVCSFVARLGDAVVVTNSEMQLRRLVAVGRGEAPALAGQPEYAFFRDRYARGDPQETALLVVSDAAIRRWCGPRWRIGSSRRVRADAALAAVQAAAVEAFARGEPEGRPGPVADAPPGLGTVERTAHGVRSSVYGTLGFLTPISELNLGRVSQAEADLYSRWRDGYQQNWNGVFDPIAARFSLANGSFGVDLSVRPLILGSDYRDFVDLARNASIAPQACDPHDGALLQFVVAVDRKAGIFGRETAMLKMMLPQLDPFGWLGTSVSVYADDDPFWQELGASEDPESFLEDAWRHLPVAVHAEVANPLLLTAFLVGLRGLADQGAPGMLVWENQLHGELPWVKVSPSSENAGAGEMFEDMTLCYAASADGLVITPNQALLERALDRRVARHAQDALAADAAPPPALAWLGEHLCARLDGKLLVILDEALRRADANELRDLSLANLPILNEWHRLFPGEDPLATHERLWKRRLTCPGGGSYRWNEEWQTMESSVYGHPCRPLPGPALPPALRSVSGAQAGITFEADGLRARVELALRPE